VEFVDLVRTRRMTRAFSRRAVPDDLVVDLVDLASRSPSAGKSQGWNLVVLRGDATESLWSRTFTPETRASFRWQGMFDAPVVALSFADPRAYLARYSEPDKAHTGLGESVERWSAPMWTIDAAFATMTLMHAAHDRGLGALFFIVDKGRSEVLDALGVPSHWELLGALALGWPLSAERDDRREGDAALASENGSEHGSKNGPDHSPEHNPGRSAGRPRRTAQSIIHFDTAFDAALGTAFDTAFDTGNPDRRR
jgi:nitroreductase